MPWLLGGRCCGFPVPGTGSELCRGQCWSRARFPCPLQAACPLGLVLGLCVEGGLAVPCCIRGCFSGISLPVAGPRGDALGVPFNLVEEWVLGSSSTLCFGCPRQESLRGWGQHPGTRRCPNPCRDGASGQDAAARPAAPPALLPAISGALPRRGASLPRLVGKLGLNRARDKPAAATGLCRGSVQRDSLTPQRRHHPLPFLCCLYRKERLLLFPRTQFPKPAVGPLNI